MAAVSCSQCPAACTVSKCQRRRKLSQHRLQTGRVVANSALKENLTKVVQSGTAALSLSLLLQSTASLDVNLANATELDIVTADVPSNHILDDAKVLSKSTTKELAGQLSLLSSQGISLDVVTIRKLTVQPDAYDFAETVLEKWYPDDASSHGLLLMVSAGKEGALAGGEKFQMVIPAEVAESIETDNIPYFTEQEKYNEAITSSVKRISSSAFGLPDPGPPAIQTSKKGGTFKTRAETDEKRGTFSTVVISLLVIAFVVPMVQYYGYVAKRD